MPGQTQERLGNLGYAALKVEATKGTAVTPDDYLQLYDESLTTNLNLVEDNPVAGQKFGRYSIYQGQRSHGGEITVLAEPNTTSKLFNMLLNKVSSSGTAPTTHSFALNSTDPKSYTLDLGLVSKAVRFIGVEAESIKPTFEENEMRWQVKVSARKSFIGREITSVAAAVVTLNTAYDPTPTDGLVASDLVQIYDVSAGTYQNFTVVSMTATTVTLSGSPTGIVSGDVFELRAATPSFVGKTPFLFSRMQWCFGATAAAALSATQTQVEQGSEFEIMHPFEKKEGAIRSGTFDPASLPRVTGDVSAKVKLFFDTPEQAVQFVSVNKAALVIRCYSETLYECRITINNYKLRDGGKPMIKSNEILYQELDLAPMYDTSDGQAFDVKVLNNLTTI